MFAFLLGSALAAQAVRAVHVATPTAEGIAWESTYEVVGSGELSLVDGRKVPVEGRRLSLHSEQAHRHGLEPPLAAGAAWQRIDLNGLEWTPEEALGLERRLRSWAPAQLRPDDRLRLDLLRPPRGISAYVDGSRAVLPGVVELGGAVSAGVSAAVGLIFAALIAAAVLGIRVVDRFLRREQAQAYLEKELGLGPPP